MFLGSPSPWWRRLDLSGLNEPLQASKNLDSDLLKCFWQALKRLPSLTKMGSIKMSDERNVFLVSPWFRFSISAASMQPLSPTSRRSYQPITSFLIKRVSGHLGMLLRMQRLDSLLQKTKKKKDKHNMGQTPLWPSAPAATRRRGNFLLFQRQRWHKVCAAWVNKCVANFHAARRKETSLKTETFGQF